MAVSPSSTAAPVIARQQLLERESELKLPRGGRGRCGLNCRTGWWFVVDFLFDDLAAEPRLVCALRRVHFFTPAFRFFLPLVLLPLQVDRQPSNAAHDQEHEHREEPDAELVERQQDRGNRRGDQQVFDLELKAEFAQPSNQLVQDRAVAIGVDVAEDFVDVDRGAVGVDRRRGATLFGRDQFRIDRFELVVAAVVVVGRIGRVGRVQLVAVEVVGGHSESSRVECQASRAR